MMRRAVQSAVLTTVVGASLASVLFGLASCGTKPVTLVVNSLDQKTKVQNSSSNQNLTVAVNFTAAELPQTAQLATSSAGVLSFLDTQLLSGSAPLGYLVLPVKNGQLSAPLPPATPAFAAGKKLLALAEDGSDFWMLESSGSETTIIRPVNRIAVPLPATLPDHMKAVVPANATPLGFGSNTLVLKSSNALWVVVRAGQQISAMQVGFPDANNPPVAAGQIVGSSTSVWIADGVSLWSLEPSGGDWRAQKHKPDFKNMSGKIEKLAAAFELKGNQLVLSGPALAVVGSKPFIAGLTVASGSIPPSGTATPTVTTTPNVTAMTFAEARAFCDSCHATTSANAAAKAKLLGTENITAWVNNKSAISASVRDGVMPLGRTLSEQEKTRFMLFANDPKP